MEHRDQQCHGHVLFRLAEYHNINKARFEKYEIRILTSPRNYKFFEIFAVISVINTIIFFINCLKKSHFLIWNYLKNIINLFRNFFFNLLINLSGIFTFLFWCVFQWNDQGYFKIVYNKFLRPWERQNSNFVFIFKSSSGAPSVKIRKNKLIAI